MRRTRTAAGTALVARPQANRWPWLLLPLLAAAFLWASPSRAAEAFDALKGSWSGGGVVHFASGETEKLRCTARYTGGGATLSTALKCASTSAQILLSGSLDARGNRVSGSWTESSFGLSGDAGGTTSGGSIRLKISGGASGYMTLNVAGNRHTVAVSTQDAGLTGVNVTLARR